MAEAKQSITNPTFYISATSVLLSFSLLIAIYNTSGLTNTLLALVGILIGLTLIYGNFGFTGGWSAWLKQRDGRGLRAQMLIIALASMVFYPILSKGTLFGTNVTGFVAPISLATLAGSFIFGIGMQFGGCCASGALSWAGSGSIRVFITLIGFIIGSVWGAFDIEFWRSLPGVRVDLTSEFGVTGGLSITLVICATVIGLTLFFEKRRYGKVKLFIEDHVHNNKALSIIKGNWPILAVIILLVLANYLTLLIAGRPWGVTSAFTLWGSKLLALTGTNVSEWSYWNNSPALNRSIFFDVTSVMNIGILLGACVAATSKNKFKPIWKIDFKLILISIIGGLMLGYGSRIAYGCNIGAFFSGISSASLSGWVWFVSAFIGNIAGMQIKKRLSI